ncbi:MAG: DUF4012 domain-containing protein [Chloroflexota bacterium]|nr:MAG: DUF4012 domain-containing protein [Chloroflexota bacterium]
MFALRKIFLALGFLVLVLLYTIPPRTAVLAFETWRDVNAVQAAFDGDENNVTDAARALLGDARAWHAELAPFIADAARFAWLPHYGGDFAQVEKFAALADELVIAAEPTLKLYDALHENLASQRSFGAALIDFSRANAAQIELAQAALTRVEHARAKIDERELSPQAHALLRTVDRALNEWDAALRLLGDAPQLLGNDAPRHYLILAQNNDELRATGGFISAVGVLRVERGEISVVWFGDSFAVDDLSLVHSPPPAPLQKYMWASQWLLRDSNWYADFPTSARVAQGMYENDRHLKTDGVIAVDMRFLPRLVQAMQVELDGEPLSQNNVLARLKASWQPMPPGDMSAEWFKSDRKNFLSELMNGMLTRFRAGDIKTNALAQALWRGLREKSAQIYLNDADAEQAILDANWGGAVDAGAQDYLFVVDSNVGFNKVNARVTREIFYDVNLGENKATVEIVYKNPSRAAEGECDLLKQHKDTTYASMEQSCYWNYVRVLAPRGSQFVLAKGVSDAGVADDMEAVTAFGGYAIIPRNTTRTVKFDYALPARLIHNNTYSLKLQQQAGAPATPLTVRVKIPDDYSVRGASHPFTWRGQNILEFQEMLWQDTTIHVYLNR